ncbi:MAG: hypothetical protein LBB95_01990 [Mycoplasmataceae bacterium]|jgi:hypothetical protein|nr:hypothetical protein [Mycoplasmataceae bacterium]
MAKVSLHLEISDETYQSFKEKFEQLKKALPILPYNNVEDYIAHFLEITAKFNGKQNNLGDDIEKKLSSMLNSSGIDFEAISSMFKTNDTSKDKAKEEKKNDNKDKEEHLD